MFSATFRRGNVASASSVFRHPHCWSQCRDCRQPEGAAVVDISNLAQLPWPDRLQGSRDLDGGRVIAVDAGDSLEASRLLHPDLYRLFSDPLGSPFLAAIPDRDTLVLCSQDSQLQPRLASRAEEDYRNAAHPITPSLFLVTPDGIEPAETSDTRTRLD